MDLKEFNNIKNYNYNEYCDYLQKKYGKPKEAYFTKDNKLNYNIFRINDGLQVHHILEYLITDLSNTNAIYKYDRLVQEPDNLLYCDLLEHLFLHILITKQRTFYTNNYVYVGLFGTLKIIQRLNECYDNSRYFTNTEKCWNNKIKNDFIVYIQLLKILKSIDCLKSTNQLIGYDYAIMYELSDEYKEKLINLYNNIEIDITTKLYNQMLNINFINNNKNTYINKKYYNIGFITDLYKCLTNFKNNINSDIKVGDKNGI